MATWVLTRQFCRHNSPMNDELWMAEAQWMASNLLRLAGNPEEVAALAVISVASDCIKGLMVRVLRILYQPLW